MADRMIQCPECRGTRFAPIQSWNSRGICGLCIDSPGTIADRRAPTASDRAVENIRALCRSTLAADNSGDVSMFAERVLYRIEQEAERG